MAEAEREWFSIWSSKLGIRVEESGVQWAMYVSSATINESPRVVKQTTEAGQKSTNEAADCT